MKKQTVENEDAFLRKLNGGEKVIAIELDSPRNADLTGYLEGAKKLQAAGADLLTIADCPLHRPGWIPLWWPAGSTGSWGCAPCPT